jgi:hypothetical protein
MSEEDDIHLIAYGLWEQEGCPDGRDCEHWYKAKLIWDKLGKTGEGQTEQTEIKQVARKPKKFVSGKKPQVNLNL